MKGKITVLTPRGFGFIGEEPNKVFFHSKGLVDVTFDELKEGDEVTYDIEQGEKGPNAVNVRRA
jgi:CspA family cold shock protein